MADEAGPGQELLERLREETPDAAGRAVTLISASFDDGTALAVLATRQSDADGHDADEVAALVTLPGSDPTRIAEALLSTEYGPDGTAKRIGLELYEELDSVPMRIAANRDGEPTVSADGARRTVSRMVFRFDGKSGAGVHEVIDPA
jgi:hypothetical protein